MPESVFNLKLYRSQPFCTDLKHLSMIYLRVWPNFTHDLNVYYFKTCLLTLHDKQFTLNYLFQGLLEEVNRFRAEYLFQPDKCYDTAYDIGMLTIGVQFLEKRFKYKRLQHKQSMSCVAGCFAH